MTPSERIDYLVRYLAGNNAREFAKVTGIDPATISRIRSGHSNPAPYFPKIASAYPDINGAWLESGEGVPLRSLAARDEISARLDRIERELAKISKLLVKISKSRENC